MIPIPLIVRTCAGLLILACAACVGVARTPDVPVPAVFYTVTGEIALLRHEPRVAALEYASAAEAVRNADLLRRAAEVTSDSLQPTLTAGVAAHWIDVDPASVEAHRTAARAALELQRIAKAAEQYRIVLASSPRGVDAECADLEAELANSDNLYGARQLADRLAHYFPASGAARRLQAFTTLRADDPAAAVRDFEAALALPVPAALERREMQQGLWRARILAGDVSGPLAEARALVGRDGTAANRLDYALLLLAAQQSAAARTELALLAEDREAAPAALRLLGLIEFQEDRLDEAAVHFAQLMVQGKYLDDALYYLGQIAERHADYARALRLYAEVQEGDNAIPALLRAATLLYAHGAMPAADEMLDRLVEEEPQRAPAILAARARMMADAGDGAQAIGVLERAQRQYPDNVDLRYALAAMVDEQGRFAEALHELQAVAKLRPDDPAALNAYGYTLADHGRRLGLARKLIAQAYAAAPKNPAILDSLGWVLFRQGQAGQALPYLNAAYEDDRGGDTAAHLGEVLWRLGRQEDAERIWSEAARADADNRLLKATRRRLQGSDSAA